MLQSSSSDEGDYIDDFPDKEQPSLVYNGAASPQQLVPDPGYNSSSNPHLSSSFPRDSRDGEINGARGGHVSHNSKCNNSGSNGGSPSSTRNPSFDTNKFASSFDTVSISSGISVPAINYDTKSMDGNQPTPRHSHSSGHSRSNSFRGADRSPQAARRGPSPTTSIISEREREDMVKLSIEEEEHKRRLQIYVLVLRCIAFPFNAKQPHDMQKRQTKINKQDLARIKDRFSSFLQGNTSIMADEAFKNAVQSYSEVFLSSDRVTSMVRSGACSSNDFREVFKNNIEKRVRCLPEIDGLSKETVLSSWMAKFDSIYNGDGKDTKNQQRHLSSASELFLSKDQLYDMFQNILSIRKYEHLILYNTLQLDNLDEQAAQVRRELASRQQQLDSGAFKQKIWKPRFVVKEMERMYIEELNAQIQQLKANLESVPVKGGTLQKSSKKTAGHQNNNPNKIDVTEELDQCLNKVDVTLSFNIEILIKDVAGLKISGDKMIYCTMEIEGGPTKLQTGPTPASKPYWGTQGDFTTNQPLPHIKIRLMMETSSLLSLEDKELGKITLKLKPNTSRSSNLYVLHTPKSTQEEIKLRVVTRMEKPCNMKYSGNLWALGKRVWKTSKLRYFVLVQVSQYNFAICTYKDKKSEPVDMLQLKGFTVDYCEHIKEMERDGLYFFNMVKEGDCVTFSTMEETDRHGWVQALYRATGQSHKPTPPDTAPVNGTGKGMGVRVHGEIDRARKHGLDEFVSADPCEFDQAGLFKYLQSLSMEYRMNDAFTCMGWFSPGQIYILDEYVARYAVRGCNRHLYYLSDLLDKAEGGLIIDPTLMHYSFAFCASHVYGNKPDGLGTITTEERSTFEAIRVRLRTLVEHQITNFRFCFPFGRPEGALKATLSLLERVLMKDMGSPIAIEEVRVVVKKCLENAALVNYTRITEFARIDETSVVDNTPERLEETVHLATLCIEVMQQNEEHHADAFNWFTNLLTEHNEMFWSLFAVDMDSCLENQLPESWDSFALFTLLNSFLLSEKNMCEGPFHIHLRDRFAPQVVRYVDLMESSIGQSIDRGFSKESWEAQGSGCATSEEMLWKLEALQAFIRELNWPDEIFAEHLDKRLKLMASDMIEAAANRTIQAFDNTMFRMSKSSEFLIPSSICVMINALSDYRTQAMTLCMSPESAHQYHSHIDEILESGLSHTKRALVNRLTSVVEVALTKLKRYDEGSLLKTLLSLTKPTDELGKEYILFVRSNLDMVQQKTTDGIYVNSLFEEWYTHQIERVNVWLADRLELPLHSYQLTCLIHIIRKSYSDFELQGVPQDILNSQSYQSVCTRLTVEEATHACIETRNVRLVTGAPQDEGDS